MDYLVVSNNHVFLISGHDGNVTGPDWGLGLYHKDTRHLSGLRVCINGTPPELLSGSDEEAYRSTLLLTNATFQTSDGTQVPPGTIGISRTRVVSDAAHERVTLTNYNRFALTMQLSLDLAADFADVFQVRGIASGGRGTMQEPVVTDGKLELSYEGKDRVVRSMRVSYSRPPDTLTHSTPHPGGAEPGAAVPASGSEKVWQAYAPVRVQLTWNIRLDPHMESIIELTYSPHTSEDEAPGRSPSLVFEAEDSRMRASYEEWVESSTQVATDNHAFNELLKRSTLDLRALIGTYPTGPVPFAGIPWYAVPFGRDSLIAALQTIAFQPELAKGTLRFLAARQGTKDDPWRDEQPGKIMHELRFGDLAGTGAIPHTPYYGSVDSTPLFVMLFAETMRWTGDETLYTDLMPHVRDALDWIDGDGDPDRDGYLEYVTRSEKGIRNQGWKDSPDSLLYPDGTPVEPPAALVEVQAYVYAAKTWLTPVVRARGESELAARLEREAAALRERFNRDYYLADAGYYAQALDRDKQPVRDTTSNPAHALMCGILPEERAREMARRLVSPDLSSGWGLRTRASSDPNYNPMSYHNGSVWPHDTSLAVWGLVRHGLHEEANELAGQLLAAACRFPRSRLPELYCGFPRQGAALDRPAEYPVSCSPQAWAAGTGLLILRSILGLKPDTGAGTVQVSAYLPDWLQEIEIHNLHVGIRKLSLRIDSSGSVVYDGPVS